jgi:hypothetical protein
MLSDAIPKITSMIKPVTRSTSQKKIYPMMEMDAWVLIREDFHTTVNHHLQACGSL